MANKYVLCAAKAAQETVLLSRATESDNALTDAADAITSAATDACPASARVAHVPPG